MLLKCWKFGSMFNCTGKFIFHNLTKSESLAPVKKCFLFLAQPQVCVCCCFLFLFCLFVCFLGFLFILNCNYWYHWYHWLNEVLKVNIFNTLRDEMWKPIESEGFSLLHYLQVSIEINLLKINSKRCVTISRVDI